MLHPSQAVSLCVVKPTSQYLWGKTEGCILGYREIPCLKIFDFLIKWKEHNLWHRERVSWTERKGFWDLLRAFWTQTVLHYNCGGALLLFDTLYIKEPSPEELETTAFQVLQDSRSGRHGSGDFPAFASSVGPTGLYDTWTPTKASSSFY